MDTIPLPRDQETVISMRIKNLMHAKAITAGPAHHFFGYYDKCPWSADGNFILCMAVPFMDHFPKSEPATIGLVDVNNGFLYRQLAETRAWNWQQGAMLQWLPPNSDRYVIYNDIVNGELKSVIRDIKTTKSRLLPRPIAALDHSGRMALSLNFGRLYKLRRAYGYYGAQDPWDRELHPADDGIYRMDLDSGKCQMITSLERIAGFEPTITAHAVKHWVNHLAFNPSGTRFCFLHRFEIPEINHFGTRLFTANTNGTDLKCLWTGQVSHFDWFNNDKILAWTLPPHSMTQTNRVKSSGLKILKKYDILRRGLKKIPLIRSHFIGGRFSLFNDKGGKSASIETIGDGILTEDGHCSYSPDRQLILMDLYPDISNHRTLMIYNDKNNSRIDIGRFHSPRKLRDEIRCDLHARWNRDGTQICIDSAHEGTRQMYILDVSSIVKKLAR